MLNAFTAQRIRLLEELDPSDRYVNMLIDDKVAASVAQLQGEVKELEDQSSELDEECAKSQALFENLCAKYSVEPPEYEASEITTGDYFPEVKLPEKYSRLKKDFSQEFPSKLFSEQALLQVEEKLDKLSEFEQEYNEKIRKINNQIPELLQRHFAEFEQEKERLIAEKMTALQELSYKEKNAITLFEAFEFKPLRYENSEHGVDLYLKQIKNEICRLYKWIK